MAATLQVPATDLAAQWREIADEVEPVVLARLRSGNYLGMEAVEAFEQEFAAYVGGGVHAVACSSGTDAVELMVRATTPDGAVIDVPSGTFVATLSAVERAQRVAVTHRNIRRDPRVSNEAGALIPYDPTAHSIHSRIAVWLYGSTRDAQYIADECASHGIQLLEDASQAHGNRKAGRFGVAAAWSLYPGKNLGAAGQAGVVTFRHKIHADKARLIREHGYERATDRHVMRGFNLRMDGIQADVLRAKLRRLDAWVARKRQVALMYLAELAGIDGLTLPTWDPDHAWHQFSVRVRDRDAVLAALKARGIGAMVHYRATADGRESDWTRENLSLPIYPHISDEQVAYVVESVKAVLA